MKKQKTESQWDYKKIEAAIKSSDSDFAYLCTDKGADALLVKLNGEFMLKKGSILHPAPISFLNRNDVFVCDYRRGAEQFRKIIDCVTKIPIAFRTITQASQFVIGSLKANRYCWRRISIKPCND